MNKFEDSYDKIKLKHGIEIDIEYIVKKESGTVIAITSEDTHNLFRQFVDMKYNTISLYRVPNKYKNRVLMPSSYKGVAKLNPEDEWSEESGKRIAKHKLRNKINNSMKRRCNFLVEYLKQISDNIKESI